MYPFFQNKYVRFGGGAIVILFLLFIVFAVIIGSLNDARSGIGLSNEMGYGGQSAPNFAMNKTMSDGMRVDSDMVVIESEAMYYPPEPSPSNYTSNLETYETTTYVASGRTKEFDEACSTITNLKTSSDIHFQSINTGTNYCQASFFAEEEQAVAVTETLKGFKGIEVTRNTSSVTRHRQQLQSQTNILQQQLARVDKTLQSAEAQLNRLNSRFHSTDEVTALSSEVTNSLRFIDQMTSKKISLISQLNNTYQQATDLEARMDVVEFSVNFNRANPIYPSKFTSQWDNAWEEVKEQFNETLIGVTAVFAIFLFWVFRIALYLIVLIVVLRGFWKFVKLLWNK